MINFQNKDSQSIHFEYAGLFETENEWMHPKRIIDTYEIIYVTEGTVYLQENEKQYSLTQDDIFLLTPGLEHKGYQLSRGKTSFYWAHFTCSDFEQLGLKNGLWKSSENYSLSMYFKQLLHKTNTFGYPEYIGDISLCLILSEIFFLQNSSDQNAAKLVSDIIEWVRINKDKKLTVRSVANHFSYHPDYLCILFKKHGGIQLKKYINNERLKYIKHIILTTNLSIKEIAFSLGWDNENQFIHYFTYHEKISPAKLRGLYYNNHLNNK